MLSISALRRFGVCIILLTAGLWAGCQSMRVRESVDRAAQVATTQGFTAARLDTGRFTLLTYLRTHEQSADPLVIYIEGDGHAYVTRSRVADNPTPSNLNVLHMAAADPARSVAYVARPCQFIQPLPSQCRSRWWTSHRYGDAVIAAIDSAIDRLIARTHARRIGLVGFSGGATIAALLAERRPDIDWLVTVAGNLDPDAWTAWHGDTPLRGSRNPVDALERLAALPQVHIAGGEDKIVPAELIRRFVQRLPAGTPARFMIANDMAHEDATRYWRRHVCELRFWRDEPACGAP